LALIEGEEEEKYKLRQKQIAWQKARDGNILKHILK